MTKIFQGRAKHAVIATSLLGSLFAASAAVHACGDPSSAYIGAICTFAFSYCPAGTLPADGRTLSVNGNQALYALLGNRYGGDGVTNFALPDLRGRTVVGTGAGQNPSLTNVVLAAKTGAEYVTLNQAQTPVAAHTHPATLQNGTTQGSLAVSGTSTAAVTGNVTVNALTTAATTPSPTPSGTNNVIGKIGGGGGQTAYYAYDATKAVAVPATTSGLNANGTVSGTATGTVVIGANTGQAASQPVSLINPRLGLTVCIVTQGLFPPQP